MTLSDRICDAEPVPPLKIIAKKRERTRKKQVVLMFCPKPDIKRIMRDFEEKATGNEERG
jgi:hypothetical protein